jgi:hypothetical protein
LLGCARVCGSAKKNRDLIALISSAPVAQRLVPVIALYEGWPFAHPDVLERLAVSISLLPGHSKTSKFLAQFD